MDSSSGSFFLLFECMKFCIFPVLVEVFLKYCQVVFYSLEAAVMTIKHVCKSPKPFFLSLFMTVASFLSTDFLSVS